MPGIFICYRREDSDSAAGRIYDRLVAHFRDEKVFLDVDTIPPGADFKAILETAVGLCDVVIVVIGSRWLTTTHPLGRSRLENPDDFVRLEIVAALSRDTFILPVLVNDAKMPRAHEMPEVLSPMARIQATEIRHTSFGRDVEILVAVIKRHLTLRTRARKLIERGRIALESSQHSSAIDLFQQAKELFPKDEGLRELLTRAESSLKEEREYDARLKRVQQLTAEGEQLFRANRFLEAQVVWGHALCISPNNSTLKSWIDRASRAQLVAISELRKPHQSAFSTLKTHEASALDEKASNHADPRSRTGKTPLVSQDQVSVRPRNSHGESGTGAESGAAREEAQRPTSRGKASGAGNAATLTSLIKTKGTSAAETSWSCSECNRGIGAPDMETYFATGRCNLCQYNW
jgi:tetratricopeptide (TPR) repeat protein